MTAKEIYRSIVMLLDEGWDDFFTKSDIEHAVNRAQMQILEKLVSISDEIGLRPFYTHVFTAIDSVFEENVVLYPRGCNLWYHDSNTSYYMTSMTYKNYSELARMVYFNVWDRGTEYRDALYTLEDFQTYEDGYLVSKRKIRTNVSQLIEDDYILEFAYIKVPPTYFVHETNDALDVNVTLLQPYIPELILTAAEFLNTIDVSDNDRGDIALIQMGQRLTFEGVANV